MTIRCDNQAITYIACNLLFYERNKHIEINCYFVRDAMMTKIIYISLYPLKLNSHTFSPNLLLETDFSYFTPSYT